MQVWPTVVITLWCLVISAWDLRTRTIPPWLTWPVILGSGVWMAWKGWWVPLALFAWFFLWDTTWGDMKALFGLPHGAADERWLIPEAVGWAGTAVGVMGAGLQGEPALAVAWFWALLHGLWRVTGRAGGDVAFAMAIFGLFPTLHLWYVPLLVSLIALVVEVVRRRDGIVVVGYALALGRPLEAWRAWRSLPSSGAHPQAPIIALMAVLMALTGGQYGVWRL